MKIKEREADGVTILEVSGEMYGGPENLQLLEMATKLAEDKRLQLVIHFGKVKWVASTGLGILVTTKTRYEKAGGRIKLCNLNNRVLSLFQVTKLNAIMDTYSSEQEAVAAFAKES
jgi:anti-sigma B factor antagonist